MAAKSNLFAIDTDAVLRAIEEANKPLVERHNALIKALDRVPPHLETEEDIERGKKFAGQLKEAYRRCRTARLADTKPIRELLKRVEAFFKTMEKEAFDAREEVVAALGEAGRRRAVQAPLMPSTNSPSASGDAVIINRETGEVFGTVSPTAAGTDQEDDLIPLAWHVDTVDRNAVDLEALRPFITDAALLSAARAHLKAKGPHSLRGATYIQEAAID